MRLLLRHTLKIATIVLRIIYDTYRIVGNIRMVQIFVCFAYSPDIHVRN